MADKTVGMLENVPALHDESLIPVEQSGELMNATGRQFREFAEQAAEQFVEDATEVAKKAEQALAALGNDAQIAKKAAAAAADSEAKAKLYADQTEAAAGGGVASFNGRGGHVIPQSGDYTADMVGAVPVVMSGRGTVEVLFGDHNAIKNYRDSTVPSAPVVANYTHFITYDTAGKVYSVLSLPDEHTSLACMYSVVAKKWFTFATTDTAAPAGFGYGEACKSIYISGDTDSSLTTAKIEEYYQGLANGRSMRIAIIDVAGLKDGHWFEGKMYRYSASEGTLELYATHGLAIKRYKDANVWQPWEWVNPPMALGVEYRTTERYMGKPVYAQLVRFGALPNSSRKSVEHGIAGIEHVCGVYAEAKYPNDTSLSMIGWGDITVCFATNTSITVTTTADRSGYNGYFTLKYTKTTD